jgi:hypothetical protein
MQETDARAMAVVSFLRSGNLAVGTGCHHHSDKNVTKNILVSILHTTLLWQYGAKRSEG